MTLVDDPHASYKLLRAELVRRGYQAAIFKLGQIRVIEFTKEGRRAWVTSLTRMYYPLVYSYANNIANNKSAAYQFVERLGVPVPFTRTVTRDETLPAAEMEMILQRYGRLIVKPQHASLSRGLTMDITAPDELQAAIDKARQFDRRYGSVLVQQQVAGEEIRFTVLNGKVIAALLRRTSRVVGDGRQTVAELIAAENADRTKIRDSMAPYPQLNEENIDAGHLVSERVLGEGEVLELNHATMVKNGASIYNVIDEIHPTYTAMIERCVAALGAQYIVADMFIDDYASAYQPGNAYFNEFNVAPVLKLYYSCRDGRHVDIVPKLVDAIDRSLAA